MCEKTNPDIEVLDTKNYKEIPYTIEIDWQSGNAWLNNHIAKEKIVITEKDFESIENVFKLIKFKDSPYYKNQI